MAKESLPHRRWAVCYDIRAARVRRRVARLLEGEGVRLQRSVFLVECSPDQAARLHRRCRYMMQATDRLLIEAIGPAWPVPWARADRLPLPGYWVL
jgi:CRISPR/Cas system-associated endoribonuclease Cas2